MAKSQFQHALEISQKIGKAQDDGLKRMYAAVLATIRKYSKSTDITAIPNKDLWKLVMRDNGYSYDSIPSMDLDGLKPEDAKKGALSQLSGTSSLYRWKSEILQHRDVVNQLGTYGDFLAVRHAEQARKAAEARKRKSSTKSTVADTDESARQGLSELRDSVEEATHEIYFTMRDQILEMLAKSKRAKARTLINDTYTALLDAYLTEH